APPVHHAHRRRGGGVAARGARAAGGGRAGHRIAGRCRGYSLEPPRRQFFAAIGRILLGRKPHGGDRITLGGCTERTFRPEEGEKQWQSTSCLRASLTKESARSVIHQNGQTPSKKWRRSAERPCGVLSGHWASTTWSRLLRHQMTFP